MKNILSKAAVSLLVLSVSIPSMARTWPKEDYARDIAYNPQHIFNVFSPEPAYQDPDFAEGTKMASPLYNPLYASYDVVIVVNRSNVLSPDGKMIVERAQRIRIYARESALQRFDSKSLQSIRYDKGSGLLAYWKVSTGLAGHITPSGHYRVFSFSSRHESSKYGNAPMPYSVFFRTDGYATHGVVKSVYDKLGTAASHGCIRNETQRAEDIFHLIGNVGRGSVDNLSRWGTPLNAKGTPVQPGEQVAKVSAYKTLYVIR